MPSETNGLTGTFPTTNPAFKGAYVFSQPQIPGTVAARNHLALFNPLGSGRAIVIGGAFISSIIVGDIATTVAPMRGWRATAISGGTLEPEASIGRVRTAMPAPAGQIFTNNPVATLGASWFNSPSLIGASKGSSPFVHQIPAAVAGGALTLVPGEGVVIRAESGDVDQRWNLSIAWSEI